MSNDLHTGRLSTLAAAFVVARRDFVAILFSRSFFFFLLGPLFPILVGGLAGGIGQQVKQSADRPELGVAMQAADADAMVRAQQLLEESDLGLEQIAQQTGFGTAAVMRHHFIKVLQTSPQAYRRAFGVREAG